MAGRDTTSAAMTWLFSSLSRHPNTEKDVVKEVVTALGNDERKLLDYEALKNLSLLKACLYESMRLYPPMAWDSKHSPTYQKKSKIAEKGEKQGASENEGHHQHKQIPPFTSLSRSERERATVASVSVLAIVTSLHLVAFVLAVGAGRCRSTVTTYSSSQGLRTSLHLFFTCRTTIRRIKTMNRKPKT
ncbi:PREDICTED: 1,25-dihydroxyvitamin D(3) 24-hydroxylase, mitochondrial-like [Nelumbo nucifera]|uniref:1,25-dihydroxyvitamin D(3) 24-hydroxylase, mitochondrial-like n=1 Tax=Nelumbo nucifera TaxID=4432 RepID=A0A1U8PZ39_NELNU|nr:PREDICTED: 1,25-dihydroxyvitamin D(3) 24-hydroxylase, mitochondrial-like [Nelumbo nucifera]